MTKTVSTTNTEVVNSTTVTDGIVTQLEEVVKTTTVEKKTTKLIVGGSPGEVVSGEEHSSEDKSGTVDNERKAEEEGRQNDIDESSAQAGIQSLLPNVKKTVLTADGKVLTAGGQTLLQGSTNKTLMVLNKDGTKTLMRVIRPSNDDDDVVSSSNSSSVDDCNIGNG